ncbi:hypothetical protein GCK72_002265 [Caenorhabditis remanei]|uniref:Uncharacterized protein n=1 Tax=Caenorhabditis remanei TaxID=31234 RepID=A0A6A5HUN6_CAERE|nr:hypothetical protein GCK72_002265 [Caenorhabditis remanei]KAF1770446.1 hypothetical protein GCK72_002265 [Caenorhabditis remanei]
MIVNTSEIVFIVGLSQEEFIPCRPLLSSVTLSDREHVEEVTNVLPYQFYTGYFKKNIPHGKMNHSSIGKMTWKEYRHPCSLFSASGKPE